MIMIIITLLFLMFSVLMLALNIYLQHILSAICWVGILIINILSLRNEIELKRLDRFLKNYEKRNTIKEEEK